MDGAIAYFRLYEQSLGMPVLGVDPLLEKSLGHDVVLTGSPVSGCAVTIHAADTAALLRNYYYEVTVIDGDERTITVATGLFTVTPTENRL